ncbi:alpha/beta-hydrolase [Mucidula mucida]|nr:alpha/beta-hydrolase [Mucidula mucida]
MRAMFLQVALILASRTLSSPIDPLLEARQSITTLSASAIAAFKTYTFYASTAYCQPSETLTWTCGSNCDANSDFQPVASGGNGDSIQFWYVGYDPSLKAVIVGHQGTDTSKLLPIITDASFFLKELDDKLFPGISADIKVHNGFGRSQADSATQVLAAVTSAMSTHSTNTVTVVGHSLGGAIALISGVYLDLQLPSTNLNVIAYGMPRVGNQEFADYVDAHLSVSHVNNEEDLVPILPGRSLGYHHCSGEKHILDSGAWVACPGQDNTDSQCTTGDVKSIFEGIAGDHSGPYDGVNMGC